MRISKALLKAILYRVYSSFLITPVIVYMCTGSWTLSAKVGQLEIIIKLFTYFIYELGWGVTLGYEDAGVLFRAVMEAWRRKIRK